MQKFQFQFTIKDSKRGLNKDQVLKIKEGQKGKNAVCYQRPPQKKQRQNINGS